MDQHIETIYVLFHNRARELFFSVFHNFNASIKGVNRHRDENLFRQQCEQYVNHLQQQLQQLAEETIREHQSRNYAGILSQNLHHFIQDYIHQFIKKVRAL